MASSRNSQSFYPMPIDTSGKFAARRFGELRVAAAGDRVRLDEGLKIVNERNASTDCLPLTYKALLRSYDHYLVADRFLKAEMFGSSTVITEISSSLDQELDEVNDMIEDFIDQLEGRRRLLNANVHKALVKVAKQDKWWEAVNIFHHDFACEMLTAMFEQNSPQDHASYGAYIAKFAYARAYRSDDPFYQAWLYRIFTEIMRISRMAGGRYTAFKLLVDHLLYVVRCNLLFCPGTTEIELGKAIHAALHDLLGNGFTATESKHPQLSQFYHQLRDGLHPMSIGNVDKLSPCAYNIMLPTMIMLQCHAREEVHGNVILAVADRLPVELAEYIVEHVMEAEGLDEDLGFIAPKMDHGEHVGYDYAYDDHRWRLYSYGVGDTTHQPPDTHSRSEMFSPLYHPTSPACYPISATPFFRPTSPQYVPTQPGYSPTIVPSPYPSIPSPPSPIYSPIVEMDYDCVCWKTNLFEP